MSTTDVVARLRRSVGWSHGILLPPTAIEPSAADVATVHHMSVSHDENRWTSAGGGVARSRPEAEIAAVAEALERYAARVAEVPTRPRGELGGHRVIDLDEWTLHSPTQRTDPELPSTDAYRSNPMMARMYDLVTNDPVWVPAALCRLSDDYGPLGTSSGLAAHSTITMAVLRGLQELVERDAFMTTWLHQVRPPTRPADDQATEIAAFDGEVDAFDITPAWSPHPVALVAASAPLRGSMRHAVGVACRSTWQRALDKAWCECLQGMMFAGQYLAGNPDLRQLVPGDVRSFERHAVFYTAKPHLWPQLPLFDSDRPVTEVVGPVADPGPCSAELESLMRAVTDGGFRVVYRELTTPDVAAVGLRVARVASPDLLPIHHDHRFPFLGGTATDVTRRYPAHRHRPGDFPSPHPHPLG